MLRGSGTCVRRFCSRGGGCIFFSHISAWSHPFMSDKWAYREGAGAPIRVIPALRGRDFVPTVRAPTFLFFAPRPTLWWAVPSRKIGTWLCIRALCSGVVGCLFATPPTAATHLCLCLRQRSAVWRVLVNVLSAMLRTTLRRMRATRLSFGHPPMDASVYLPLFAPLPPLVWASRRCGISLMCVVYCGVGEHARCLTQCRKIG